MTPCLVPLRTTTDRCDKDDTDADADDTDRRCKMTTLFFFPRDNPRYHTDTQMGHTLTPDQNRSSPRPRDTTAAAADLQLADGTPQLQVALEVGDTTPETRSGLRQMRAAYVLIHRGDTRRGRET